MYVCFKTGPKSESEIIDIINGLVSKSVCFYDEEKGFIGIDGKPVDLKNENVLIRGNSKDICFISSAIRSVGAIPFENESDVALFNSWYNNFSAHHVEKRAVEGQAITSGSVDDRIGYYTRNGLICIKTKDPEAYAEIPVKDMNDNPIYKALLKHPDDMFVISEPESTLNGVDRIPLPRYRVLIKGGIIERVWSVDNMLDIVEIDKDSVLLKENSVFVHAVNQAIDSITDNNSGSFNCALDLIKRQFTVVDDSGRFVKCGNGKLSIDSIGRFLKDKKGNAVMASSGKFVQIGDDIIDEVYEVSDFFPYGAVQHDTELKCSSMEREGYLFALEQIGISQAPFSPELGRGVIDNTFSSTYELILSGKTTLDRTVIDNTCDGSVPQVLLPETKKVKERRGQAVWKAITATASSLSGQLKN